MPDSKIKIIILDDEKEACNNLKNIITEYIDTKIEIVGIANNTIQAGKLIDQYQPDALFLDIDMPSENAFNFLTRITPFNFEVIFVTAYDDYAIKAFKLNAIDYILKPISIVELKNAVDKLSERLKAKKLIASKTSTYNDIGSLINGKAKNSRITLKDGNHIEVIEFSDIYFIEAQGSYSRILFQKNNTAKEIVMSTSLAEYEEIFPKDLFYRIHKSYLINCRHVKNIIKDEFCHVVIKDFNLPVSRRRFPLLVDFLKTNDFYYA